MEFLTDVRPSPIAGSWYAGDAAVLSRQLKDFFNTVRIQPEDISGRAMGLVVPHAGHRYSGRTAAFAYEIVRNQPRELVVILSPFHQYAQHDFLTTAYRAYQTPLGEVAVAQHELSQLEEKLESSGNRMFQIMNDGEHSLEIQLPFLQHIWNASFSLLPVMLKVSDWGTIQAFADALFEVLRSKDALVIASSDLSHFFPLAQAQMLDAETLKRIQDFDPKMVLAGELDNSAPACGAAAIAALLRTTRQLGANQVQILNYSTSADVTGDTQSVVGYGAAAVMVSA